MLAGNNLRPVAPAESFVETHAPEGIGLAGAGARNVCQPAVGFVVKSLTTFRPYDHL